MIDFINYYYDLYPIDIIKLNDKYKFIVNEEKYFLVSYDRSVEEINDIYRLNKEMVSSGSLVHEIIVNRFNKIFSIFDGVNYVLLRVYINDSKSVSIFDLLDMLSEGEIVSKSNSLNRTNWSNLWESKVDYLEYEMVHVIKKYPIVYNIIDYYIGLSENAISYLKDVSSKLVGRLIVGVTHRRISVNSTLFDLYNPLNFIVDYKVRDIAEYLKSVIISNLDVYKVYDDILSRCYFDKLNLSLLVSRLLFPSYFFDMFADIANNKVKESKIIDKTKKSSNIEDFINYVIKDSNLQSISWLSKLH